MKKDTLLFFKGIKKRFFFFFIKEDRLHFYLFLTFLAFSIIIRIYYLNTTLRFDEAFSFSFYKKPFLSLITDYSHSNNHVLSSILIHFFYKIFGLELWAIRMPALISGILFVPFTYLAARIISNKEAALLTMGITACSTVIIEFSTNARGYMLMLLAYIIILSLSDLLIKKQNLFAWLLFAVFSSIGFYSLFAMVYPFIFIIIWIFLSSILENSQVSLKKPITNIVIFSILSLVFTLLLYLPMVMKSGLKQFIYSNNNKHYDPWNIYLKSLLGMLRATWQQWTIGIPFLLSIIFIVGIIIATFYFKRISKFKIPIHLISIILFIFILLFKTPIDYSRFFLFLLPVFIIVSSSGILFIISSISRKNNRINRISINIFIVIFILVISIFSISNNSIDLISDTGKLPDAPGITDYLKEKLVEGDVVLSRCPSNLILEYYFKKDEIPSKYINNPDILNSRIFFVINKTTDQTIDFVSEVYDLKKGLYKTPVLVKETPYADIYLSHIKELSYNSKLEITEIKFSHMENYFITQFNKNIKLEQQIENLKIFFHPIDIKNETYYLVEFKIKSLSDLTNQIYFDFYGDGYDNISQEFNLSSEDLDKNYITISQIINSENIPADTKIFFRVSTDFSNEIIIKDLKIEEVIIGS